MKPWSQQATAVADTVPAKEARRVSRFVRAELRRCRRSYIETGRYPADYWSWRALRDLIQSFNEVPV